VREREFETWLARSYRTPNGDPMDSRTVATRFSGTRRLDKALGDLEGHWTRDRGRSVLAKLRYSRGDAGRGVAPLHAIQIHGDPYTGTATLRRSAVLYFEFCSAWPAGLAAPVVGETPSIPAGDAPTRRRGSGRAAWPTWPEPNDDDLLALARAVARHARFLHPEIVAAIVEDNERHRDDWTKKLAARGVDVAGYLWPRSSCAFPGVRRYAGSREIAEFHGHREATGSLIGALALDDNTYPKHVWSWILRGRPFQQFGPAGYALAHLADHKEYGNRADGEFGRGAADAGTPLFGLFTCPTNTAYLPVSLLRPTDHARPLRNLLMRRANAIYAPAAELLPAPLAIGPAPRGAWALGQFLWAEPVGGREFLDVFLRYREEEMARILIMESASRNPRRRRRSSTDEPAR